MLMHSLIDWIREDGVLLLCIAAGVAAMALMVYGLTLLDSSRYDYRPKK